MACPKRAMHLSGLPLCPTGPAVINIFMLSGSGSGLRSTALHGNPTVGGYHATGRPLGSVIRQAAIINVGTRAGKKKQGKRTGCTEENILELERK